MAPGTFHLTLAFLDDQPQTTVETLHDALGEIETAPFDLTLRGIDVFASSKPRLVWAGIDPQPALTGLRDKVRWAAGEAGIELHRERFRPHVKLARFRGQLRGDEAEKLAAFLARTNGFSTEPFSVDRFCLFRSRLHPEGAVHEVLAEYSLAG
ncbi:MAG: RNA 2',3'-cyclic phosphodiesterase [Rhodobacteraceae bacterium]|nr:RNA 2',3'-cyclic phosphodiesterase [Paracoccaceae bacterium]